MRTAFVVGTLLLTGAVCLAQVVDAPLSSRDDWPAWGRDAHRSHFQPLIAGPTTPRLLWFTIGGSTEEPAFVWIPVPLPPPPGFSPQLIVPQMPELATRGTARYVGYSFYDPLSGALLQNMGPFWGQPAAPIAFNTAVYLFGDDNSFLGFFPDWPTYAFSGGQYDSRVIAPNAGNFIDAIDRIFDRPFREPDATQIIRGRPAYRTNFGTYTDGAIGYTLFGDNFGNITAFGAIWIVVLDVDALRLNRFIVRSSEFFIMDDLVGFPPMAGAVYGIAASPANGLSARVIMGDHSGLLLCYDPTLPPSYNPAWPPPGRNPNPMGPLFFPVWGATVQNLSADDLVDPDDPSSGFDPIPSDSFDRPVAMSADGSIAIVCASNYGRVYAVDTASGNKLWGRKLSLRQRIAIMGGPSIGPDPNNGGEETVYVVGRSSPSRSSLYALRLTTGEIKWVRELRSVSRCTPMIDAGGNLFLGDDRGFLYSIRPDGSIAWTLYLGAAIRTSPVLAQLDINGDNIPDPLLFVSASDRYLYAFTNPLGPVTGGTVGIGTGGSGR